QLCRVRRQIARIFFKIRLVVKLRRIYENGDNDRIAGGPRFFYQTEVAVVQRSHRRNETDGFIFPPQLARDRGHSLPAVDDFHLDQSTLLLRFITGVSSALVSSVNPYDSFSFG